MMNVRFWLEVFAAGLGTFAFAVLFHVPRRYYLRCALIGALGWFVSSALMAPLGTTLATFFATFLVVFVSRFSSIQLRCPVTVFLISGIIPMVPGLGIYRTATFLVSENLSEASSVGLATLKTAFTMVLAMLLAFEIPSKLFLRLTKPFCRKQP